MALGSDNPFPSVLLVEQGSTPATPAASRERLYVDTSGALKLVDDAGAVSTLAPLASPTFTGLPNGPQWKSTGITGANTTPLTISGANASGAPASGAHVKGEIAGDDTGKLWYCTVAGTPGTWVDVGTSGGVATDTIWDAKGDLAGGTGADTAARLAVGTNGQLLTADSAETTGLKWVSKSEVLVVAIGDETTAITTGTGKTTFRMPFAMTLTAVRASLTTASSSGIPTFDINESGTTILSTKLTIDASEKTSTTAATAAVISDSSLADDAEITIDIDVAGTGAAGAKIYLIGTRT